MSLLVYIFLNIILFGVFRFLFLLNIDVVFDF